MLVATFDPAKLLDEACKRNVFLCTGRKHRSGPTGRYRRSPHSGRLRMFLSGVGSRSRLRIMCAEDLTKSTFVPNPPEDDLQVLKDANILPPESSAWGRYCVMCFVKRGSPKLLPCCPCNNWCHVSCSYQTHLGRICPCHVRILDPRRKIIVTLHPYAEDYVVLPTRASIRTDSGNI